MNSIPIKLEKYEGPFDLLFALIEKNEIDIYDIPIALLTDQYMEYINENVIDNINNMDSMSEFILMAATLIELKARLLLPKPKLEEEENDPREDFVAKLIEYKFFKDVSEQLKERHVDAIKFLYRDFDIKLEITDEKSEDEKLGEFLSGVTLEKLYKAFNDVVLRKEAKTDKIRSTFNSIERDLYTIESKIEYLRDLLNINEKISFSRAFHNDTTKSEIIVTFLALMELIKRREVLVFQAGIFDEIVIEKHRGII